MNFIPNGSQWFPIGIHDNPPGRGQGREAGGKGVRSSRDGRWRPSPHPNICTKAAGLHWNFDLKTNRILFILKFVPLFWLFTKPYTIHRIMRLEKEENREKFTLFAPEAALPTDERTQVLYKHGLKRLALSSHLICFGDTVWSLLDKISLQHGSTKSLPTGSNPRNSVIKTCLLINFRMNTFHSKINKFKTYNRYNEHVCKS